MKKIKTIRAFLLLAFIATGSAQAAEWIKITKSNSVIGYREPTKQSRMIIVFKEGEQVEVVAEKDGWLKVKVPFENQGYFITGWVDKNSPNVVHVIDDDAKELRKAEPVDDSQHGIKSSMPNDNLTSEMGGDTARFVKVFVGPVYDLYRYGSFQYRFGVSYELPLSQTVRLGFPISYLTGDGFHSVGLGIQPMYSIYFGSVALTTHAGLGFEHFFGGGKSFESFNIESGIALEFSISDHLVLGVSPFTAQAMVWNSTDSINKVPFNVRGQSLIFLRGRW